MEIINSLPGYGTCWYSGPACALSSGGKVSVATAGLEELPLSHTHSPSDAAQAVSDPFLQSRWFDHLRYP